MPSQTEHPPQDEDPSTQGEGQVISSDRWAELGVDPSTIPLDVLKVMSILESVRTGGQRLAQEEAGVIQVVLAQQAEATNAFERASRLGLEALRPPAA